MDNDRGIVQGRIWAVERQRDAEGYVSPMAGKFQALARDIRNGSYEGSLPYWMIIIVTPQSPVSSPQKLQELAEMPETPVPETTVCFGPESPDEDLDNDELRARYPEVQVCNIEYRYFRTLRDKVNREEHWVLWHDAVKYATFVLSLRTKDGQNS